ncbi:GNAT family N-acetyltransferase [Hymenobacter amundsenii]|uniref:GNAT family N-acetyltransferase n=1 Tax=Hymenobacter amundsenii TaxID=2006685 RepID=A0A246FG40_9BACT|nr:GNAT family N-acetyltransferase [Hymenobacter amundsenii]OWP61486.1 GNAT family N-acetyltransferase [Hymenobacter amundsenii]
MLLRPATAADIPALLDILRQVVPLMQASGNQQWSADYPNAAVLEQDVAAGHLWLVELDGQVAGFAALTHNHQDAEYTQADWDFAEPALVTHRLAVAPAARGRGVAAALLAQAETLARQQGLRVLRLDTNSENGATQRLFPKLGYRYAGEITLAFRPRLRFFCYEKPVG